MTEPAITLGGVTIHRALLDDEAQGALVEAVRAVAAAAPFYRPRTRFGKPLSARMTAAGALGWWADERGYRYVERHPVRNTPFPPLPDQVLALWRRFERRADPDCCLINYYGEGARMGLHQDRDEADFSFPVVSISLGDPGLFRVGGVNRPTPSRSVWLASGDVAILEGPARLVYHGVDRIRFGASPLLPRGGRINLTLRRARPA